MRPDGDSWDIKSSVGTTALFVAAARALATAKPRPIAADPFAALFVRVAGEEWKKVLDDPVATAEHPLNTSEFGLPFQDYQASRTRYFDDYFDTVMEAGIEQVVIVAAGLDSRAYRLPWPEPTVIYELDRPEVLEFKRDVLKAHGHKPTAERREIAVDLREDWPKALRDAGFDPSRPSAWLVEGLLMYLRPADQDRLFESLTLLAAPGSCAAVEEVAPVPQETFDGWKAAGKNKASVEGHGGWARMIYNDPHADVAEWFTDRGWDATRTGLADHMRSMGLEPHPASTPGGLMPSIISLVTVHHR
jgi:methyltransferase (TIGR00027 family)